MKRLAIAALITTTGCPSVNAMDSGRVVEATIVLAGLVVVGVNFNDRPAVPVTEADLLPDTGIQEAYQPRQVGKQKRVDKRRYSSASHVNQQPLSHSTRHGKTFTETATVKHQKERAASQKRNTGTRRQRARNKSAQS